MGGLMYIVLYLAAIVAANLLVSQFGASIAIVNAFVFIGLDLTSRDALHEHWQGKKLWRNMTLLVGAGSILSAALNWQAANIALASFVSFTAAGLVDTLTYNLLKGRARFTRVNVSNLATSAVDSLIFPILAFGLPVLWGVVIGQFIAKILGGLVWYRIFTRQKVAYGLS
jgi:uncharacterized PurR-regulated membrane protein YhhQ (DUF165 family)